MPTGPVLANFIAKPFRTFAEIDTLRPGKYPFRLLPEDFPKDKPEAGSPLIPGDRLDLCIFALLGGTFDLVKPDWQWCDRDRRFLGASDYLILGYLGWRDPLPTIVSRTYHARTIMQPHPEFRPSENEDASSWLRASIEALDCCVMSSTQAERAGDEAMQYTCSITFCLPTDPETCEWGNMPNVGTYKRYTGMWSDAQGAYALAAYEALWHSTEFFGDYQHYRPRLATDTKE